MFVQTKSACSSLFQTLQPLCLWGRRRNSLNFGANNYEGQQGVMIPTNHCEGAFEHVINVINAYPVT